MREMAKKRGVTLEELGNLAKKDPSIDKALDERQIQLGKKEDNFIIDGRLSFHFIPHSIKIFIDVDLKEGARRILNDINSGLRKEEQAKNIQEIVQKTLARKKSETERYQKYYHLDPSQKSHYDFVIDSTNNTADKVAEKIIKFIKGSHN